VRVIEREHLTPYNEHLVKAVLEREDDETEEIFGNFFVVQIFPTGKFNGRCQVLVDERIIDEFNVVGSGNNATGNILKEYDFYTLNAYNAKVKISTKRADLSASGDSEIVVYLAR